MLRVVTDLDVNGKIIRGLRRRLPDADLVRAQDLKLTDRADPILLEWAANNGRVLISADRSTMVEFAWQRVREGKAMPGLLALGNAPIGQILDDLCLTVECYESDDCKDQVRYIPL